ncbi:MAG: hypothetical protein ACLSVD_17725 [Eggerthellaceae bacterium]
METMLAMMLCLPYGLGGYGLEKPLINHRVDVPSSSKGWPIARTAYAIFAGRRRSCASSTIARGTTSTPIGKTATREGAAR